MRRYIIRLLSAGLALCLQASLFAISPPDDEENGDHDKNTTVLAIRIEGAINPLVAEYIVEAIDEASADGRECLIIEMDTPGGLLESTRTITKAILASEVPVVVYVSPNGARAASAGVFITYASHIAVMAPTTNIGAAHPVGIGGGADTSDTRMEKVTNDAVAQIKAVAEKRGRNAEWAEDAVRKSVSITETEALEKNVIEFIAPNIDSLLVMIDGHQVELVNRNATVKTADAKVVRKEMNWRHELLNRISDPNIAYILMLLGVYGLFFELYNPGAIVPGVVGGICLILALYALQTLPVNWAGVLLILLAIILFIVEVKVPSFGVLTIGGVISMFLGSIMLFKDPVTDFEPVVRVSMQLIIIATLTTAVFFVFALSMVVKAHRRQVTTGSEGMIGEIGEAITAISPNGQVKVHGEIWKARSDSPIEKGEEIKIVSVEGLRLRVVKNLTED